MLLVAANFAVFGPAAFAAGESGAGSAVSREIAYGDPDAPVTIYEYASLTCGHCEDFHTEVLPELKKRLIDTGKARLVFKDFPLDQLALRAAVMVRCNTAPRRLALLDVLFRTQTRWRDAEDPVAALLNTGRAAGMSMDDLQACFNNKEVIDGVIQDRLTAEQEYQIEGTPSFVIDGKVYKGGMPVERFVEIVEGLQL